MLSNNNPVKGNSYRGYVYLILFIFKGGRYYKIGHSDDPEARCQQLSSLPGHCELLHSIEVEDKEIVETYWHERFKDQRVPGTREWFDLSHEEVETFLHYTRIRFDPHERKMEFEENRSRVREYRRQIRGTRDHSTEE